MLHFRFFIFGRGVKQLYRLVVSVAFFGYERVISIKIYVKAFSLFCCRLLIFINGWCMWLFVYVFYLSFLKFYISVLFVVF